ncbi:Fur-regulated basic protein FbpA [Alkalihalobacterium alkalinitrilicum]|uniref:Fur-regulated basic protein FbpA n=1 Tax=Alkalihalobacterium alkalinitrilicum TaxID=427920 RepID=UPI0009956558|nr:Fur-regulated basic protein FbpA [Alkalihalobacterium alkalinitrilicum]
MNNQTGLLRRAVEAKKQELIAQLISTGVTKMSDGRQLYELTLTELQDEFRKVRR